MTDKPKDVQPGDTLPDTVPYLRRQVDCLKAELAVTQLAHGRLTAQRDRLQSAGEELLAALCGLTISADNTQFRLIVTRANVALKNMQAALTEGDAK